MDDDTASTYGDRIADVYDDWYSGGEPLGEVAGAVSFLHELAGRGPALELGIGTGRVALPLLEAGVEVHGIDGSEAMVSKLRAADDLGARDRDLLVDGVHQICLLLRYVCGLEGLAEGA